MSRSTVAHDPSAPCGGTSPTSLGRKVQMAPGERMHFVGGMLSRGLP